MGKERMIYFRGKAQSIKDWCAELGMKRRTFEERISRGWPLYKALETPVGKFMGDIERLKVGDLRGVVEALSIRVAELEKAIKGTQ